MNTSRTSFKIKTLTSARNAKRLNERKAKMIFSQRFARFRFLTTGPFLEHLQRVEGQCITLLPLFMFCFFCSFLCTFSSNLAFRLLSFPLE